MVDDRRKPLWVRFIDSITDRIGSACAWLAILMMALTCLVVVMRYVFGEGSILFQETVVYLHATLLMSAIPYGIRHNSHVRVDVFRQRFSKRGAAIIDCVGMLIWLIPVSLLIGIGSLEYVAASWRLREASQEVGGLPLVFLLKTLIPLSALLMVMQGVAEAAKHWAARSSE